MATVGEIKALLAEVIERAGAAWQAVEAEKYNLGGAIEQAYQAVQIAAMVYEGTGHPMASMTIAQLNKAESEGRESYAKLEEMQESLLAAQQQAQEYMGILG